MRRAFSQLGRALAGPATLRPPHRSDPGLQLIQFLSPAGGLGEGLGEDASGVLAHLNQALRPAQRPTQHPTQRPRQRLSQRPAQRPTQAQAQRPTQRLDQRTLKSSSSPEARPKSISALPEHGPMPKTTESEWKAVQIEGRPLGTRGPPGSVLIAEAEPKWRSEAQKTNVEICVNSMPKSGVDFRVNFCVNFV